MLLVGMGLGILPRGAPWPGNPQASPAPRTLWGSERAPLPYSAGRRGRGDRFSCSMPAPTTSSRHPYTGHRQGSTQAAPRLRARIRAPLSRELCALPVLMPSFRLSMRQQWFTHVRLLAAHLTR